MNSHRASPFRCGCLRWRRCSGPLADRLHRAKQLELRTGYSSDLLALRDPANAEAPRTSAETRGGCSSPLRGRSGSPNRVHAASDVRRCRSGSRVGLALSARALLRLPGVYHEEDGEPSREVWLKRKRQTEAKLTGGDPLKLAEVVRDGVRRKQTLLAEKRNSRLSLGENDLYEKARQLLAGELGIACGFDPV